MKIALVTGASSGIGRTLVESLTAAGYQVWAGVRKEADLQSFKTNAQVVPLLLDVTEETHLKNLAERLTREAPQGLHALVNNAGAALPGPWELLTETEVENQFKVNVFGPIALVRTAMPFLRRAQGRVVNIGSISGRIASPYLGAYSASKFALEAFSDSLRREIAPQGISVSLVDPGPIRTPIWQKSGKVGLGLISRMSDELKGVYGKPLSGFQKGVEDAERRADPPEKVADAVLHALTAKCPRPRYFVGRGIGLQAFLARVLSDRAMDRLLRRFV